MTTAIQKSLPATHQTTWQTWKENLSQVDWKTYSLVVLSYMLIGFGIALACSSFYIAFVAHPMIAMGSPAVLTISGIFLRAHAQQKLKSPGTDVTIEGPKGIERKGYNCWVISALQMFFHIPAFKKLLLEASDKEKKRALPLIEAFKAYREGRAVDAQKVREWLHGLNADTKKDATVADDANSFINIVLKKFKRPFPQTNTVKYFTPQNDKTLRVPFTPQDQDLAYLTPLIPTYFKPDQTMQTALNNLFHNKEPLLRYNLGTKEAPQYEDGEVETTVSLPSPPDTLSFTVSGTFFGQQQAPEKFYDGMVVRLNKEQVGQDSLYGCDGFIIQQNAGTIVHYVAYVLEGGIWWELNDDFPARKLSLSAAKEALEDATFVHYAKVCSLQSQ